MNHKTWLYRAAAASLFGAALTGIAMRLPALARQGDSASKAPALTLSSDPPPGAIVLYSGKADDLAQNFYQRYSKDAPGWTVDANGVATPNKHDVTSKQEFGDLYVHVEFHEPVKADGTPDGSGNSGVGFQGRYEVQILDSYDKEHPDQHDCGALYDQKPPRLNGLKKPTEWQTYDIFFRAPRFDGDDKRIEKARATVILNGVVVQNNEEFNGPTGIQYGENKGEVKMGPLVLQGDHDPVQFRKCWVVPLN